VALQERNATPEILCDIWVAFGVDFVFAVRDFGYWTIEQMQDAHVKIGEGTKSVPTSVEEVDRIKVA
jgi:hypothetical protein